MCEDLDYRRNARVIEQNVEETFAHVRQVIACIGALDCEATVSDRLSHGSLNLANNFKDKCFEEVI